MTPSPTGIDALTGAFSRASLEARLAEETDRVRRYGGAFSLLLMDLDHFKSVNDAFGHARGDEALLELVRRLNAEIRTSDLLFRYGGDEFVLLLPSTPRAEAVQLGERLLQAVSARPFAGDPPLSFTLSIGVAACPEDCATPEEIFRRADLRQYEAKRRGRARVVAEDPAELPRLEFDDRSRPVERDALLVSIRHFIDRLGEARRGILTLEGRAGSGRSRLLSEAVREARMRGYHVLTLRGTPLGRGRPYVALQDLREEEPDLPAPAAGADALVEALVQAVRARNRAGLVVAVDDLAHLDRATLELVRQLLASPGLRTAGVIATADPGGLQGEPLATAPLQESIELHGLTAGALHVWMRGILHWEPPAEFVAWMHQQTGGLPGLVRRGLSQLVERRLLNRVEGGEWRLSPEYRELPLAQRLGVERPRPPDNLPSFPTAFIGREREVREVRRRLGESRLVTLVGPGGTGKSRLAVQAAGELRGDFRDGVRFVGLAAATDAEQVPAALADAVGIAATRERDPRAPVLQYLREKEMLLVLDNLEHLLEAADFIGEIVERCPDARLLATSRERLHLYAEAVLEVAGMDVPAPGASAEAERYDAVQLFLQSARRVHPGFSVTAQDRGSVSEICRMLAGMPLAIELAAVWVRVLSTADIAAELEQGLDFLSSTARDLPERHRSLRAVFDHSWGLLTHEERRALRQMAIFRGGFDRSAAERVTGASLSLLTSLMDKSLLEQRRVGDGRVRFILLETVREYAARQLDASGEAAEVAHRHAEHYLALASRAASTGAEAERGLQELERERENLRAAWHHAVAAGMHAMISEGLEGVFHLYEARGWLHEGERVFAALVGAPAGVPEALLGRALGRRGHFCVLLGHIAEADALLTRSLALARAAEDGAEVSFVLSRLGTIAGIGARPDVARERFREALALARAAGNPDRAARAVVGLGVLAAQGRDLPEAEERMHEALGLYEQLHDQRGIARVLNNLGDLALANGDHTRARALFERSLAVKRTVGDAQGVAVALNNLGYVHRLLGDFAGAERMHREASALAQDLGYHRIVALSLSNLGELARQAGRLAEAADAFERGQALFRQSDDPWGVAHCATGLGHVALQQGDLAGAQRLYAQSLALRRQLRDAQGTAESLNDLGTAAQRQGKLPEAAEHLRAAADVLMEDGAPPLVLETLVRLAELYAGLGEPSRAAEILAVVLHHPAAERLTRARAEAVRAELAARLGGSSIVGAPRRPGEKELRELLQEARAGLTGKDLHVA